MLSIFLLAIAIIGAYKIILGIDGIFLLIKQFFGIISPFIYGFILAYVLNIPCNGIQRLIQRTGKPFLQKRRKTLSILLTYLLMIFIVYLTLRLVIPSISRSITVFKDNFQLYYNSIEEVVNYINDLSIVNIDISMNQLISLVRDFGIEKLPDYIEALFGASYAVFRGFLALISSVYILTAKDGFKAYLNRLLKAFMPEKGRLVLLKYTDDLNQNFKQYIYTQTIDGCILGTIATIELYLLGSPYAFTLGIMLGIINYIPYFGSIAGSLVAVVVVALTQGIPVALLTALILLVTQQIDGNIIQPKLMGGSFSLSPLLIIVSITLGGAVAKIFGMVVAIPIVATLKNILESIITYYEQQKQE